MSEDDKAGEEGRSRATSGHGTDPLRSIRLMWDPPSAEARGRKPKLSLDQIIDAGITIADRSGVDALSMRNVAASLGAGTMSLYTYISSKAELLELMVDRAHQEMNLVEPSSSWRDQVIDLARQFWHLYHRHPWMLQSNLQRQSLGPNVIAVAEGLFVILERAGLGPAARAHSASLLSHYIQGAARDSILELQSAEATGMDMGEYYAARADFWVTYFDVERFPAHTAIWQAGGFDDPTDPFVFGLERILDGLEALTAATAGGRS
ncbi:MAG TPA: TetR/AcrR family transcriptional regulator [Trueperaceae bacterium]|nr:TetR/AcrR family transcriptional regulator [Trueperaceae bacterium]